MLAALDGLPGYGLAEVGLAQVRAARGDLAGAAALLEPAATRLPLPATVALLGDVRAAQLSDPKLFDFAALGRQGEAPLPDAHAWLAGEPHSADGDAD